MPHPAADSEGRDYVNSLARGLAVLRAFDREHLEMTLSEVAARTGTNRAATRRFLLTLVREGYIASDGKRFRLRPAVLDLGYTALASMTFSELAGPAMEDLAARLGEACLAAVLDGHEVVYVARAVPGGLFSLNIDTGDRLPAFCASTGRTLLSALPPEELDAWIATAKLEPFTSHTVASRPRLRAAVASARAAGFAIADQEYELGFRSLAVPIMDGEGRLAAALDVTCPSDRVSLDRLRDEFVPVLHEAATRISTLLPADAALRRQSLVRGATAARG